MLRSHFANVALLVSLGACAATPPPNAPDLPDRTTPVFPKGWDTMSIARNDVRPGTLLVIFKDGDVTPICQPGVDYGGNGSQEGPAIDFTGGEQEKVTAGLKASAAKFVNASLGGDHGTVTDVKASFMTIVSKDPIGDAQQILALTGEHSCKAKFALLKKGHDLKYPPILVTTIAQVTSDYTVKVDSSVNASAGTADSLAKSIGVGGSGSLDATDSKTVHVTGAKLVQQFKGDAVIVNFDAP